MNFEQAIARLSVLLPSIDLLKFLTDNALIAGGSVVYALNEFVPVSSVGDIDVFIPSIETFKNVQTAISDHFVAKLTPMGFLGNNSYSIVNVKIEDVKTEIQLIYRPYSNPNEILGTFDLDYVQCGLFNRSIIETPRCKRSHKDRCINEFLGVSRIFRKKRIHKAINKGFKCPLVEYSNFENDISELVSLSFDKDTLHLVPLFTGDYSSSESKQQFNPKWFKMSSLTLSKIIIKFTGKQPQFQNREFSDFYRNLILTAESVDGMESKQFKVSSISYTFDICRVFKERLILMPNPLMVQRINLIPSKMIESNPINDYWMEFDPHAYDDERQKYWDKVESKEYKSVNENAIQHCNKIITKTMLVTPYYEKGAFLDKCSLSSFRKAHLKQICNKFVLRVKISSDCYLSFTNELSNGLNRIPLSHLDRVYDNIELYLHEISEEQKKNEEISHREDIRKEFLSYYEVFVENYDPTNKNKALFAVVKRMMDDVIL